MRRHVDLRNAMAGQGALHLAGGKWISSAAGERRILDDHLHDVPEAVYGLLTQVGARAARPLTIIVERDGAYPPFEQLLAEMDRARAAVAFGRGRAVEQKVATQSPGVIDGGAPYRAQTFEAYLARLYVDGDARERFLADPRDETRRVGLNEAASEALAQIDLVGLELAAQSFARKRHRTTQPRRLWRRLSNLLHRPRKS